MNMLKQTYSKLTFSLLAAMLIFSPLAGLLEIPKVEAANIWNKLTDDDFTSEHYEVRQFAVYSSYVYFITEGFNDLSIYQYYNDVISDISTFQETEGYNYIQNIVFTTGRLYALIDTEMGSKLWSYNGTWTDRTDTFPVDMTYISSISSFDGKLLAWAENFDGENTHFAAYTYDTTDWVQISDDESFGALDPTNLEFINTVENDGHLYVLLRDTFGDGDYYVFDYNGDTWTQLGNEFSGAYDVIFFNDTLYVASDEGEGYIIVSFFSDGNWNYDTTLGGNDNDSAKFAIYGGVLYAATSKEWGDSGELYSNDVEDGWGVISSFIGIEDYDPGMGNSFVTAIIGGVDGLYIGAARSVEGFPYGASVWHLDPNGIDNSVHNSGLDEDDDCTQVDMGFEFDYWGNTYDSLYINTNGTLNFDECYDGYDNADLNNPDSWEDSDGFIANMLMPFWDDLDTNGYSNILYQTTGEAPNRQFIVQWTNHYHHYETDSLPMGTFQVILFENSNQIQFQYKYLLLGLLGKGMGATIGITGNEGEYVQYSYNQVSLQDGQAIRFAPTEGGYTMNDAEYGNIYLVDEEGMPEAPTLLGPDDGANNVPLNAVLSWEGNEDFEEGYDSYILNIAKTKTFEEGIDDESGPFVGVENSVVLKAWLDYDVTSVELDDLIGTEFNISWWDDFDYEFTGLEDNTQYYWFVTAVKSRANDQSEVSEIRRFCTGDIECVQDADGDGISDEEENSAPNGGDANGDGIPDRLQFNVTSFVNSVTGHYVALETTCYMNVHTNSLNSNSLTADNAFAYPVGLLNFTLQCNYEETATIKQFFFDDVDGSLLVTRKYSEATGYKTIEDAEILNTTSGEYYVLLVTYQITDGGELDENGEIDGVIVDPSGPAENSAGVPNTGLGKIGRI